MKIINGMMIVVVGVVVVSTTTARAEPVPAISTSVGVAATVFAVGGGGGISIEGGGGVERRNSRGLVLGLDASGAVGAVSGEETDLWGVSMAASAGATRYSFTVSASASENVSFEQHRAAVGVRLYSRRYGRLALHATPMARLTTVPEWDRQARKHDLYAAGGAWEGKGGPMILRLRYEGGVAKAGPVSVSYRRTGVELAVGDERGSFGLVIDNEGLGTSDETGEEQPSGWTSVGLRMALIL